MKVIKPYFEIIEQGSSIEDLYKHIELCGRNAYKSEDKITDDSAKAFIDKICKAKHGSVLEHGTIYLKIHIPWFNSEDYQDIINFYKYNSYSKTNIFETIGSEMYVTTNYRVLKDNNRLDDLQYMCEPTEYHEKRISVRFVCSRAISHELVRHRVFTFTQESQRYCNYSKDKFGNDVTFIIPEWLEKFKKELLNKEGYRENGTSDMFTDNDYFDFLRQCESCYIAAIIAGAKPEEAREVLPNSTKTDIIMTGFISDWKHFFELRTAENAHPEMKRLTIPLKEEFIKRGYIW